MVYLVRAAQFFEGYFLRIPKFSPAAAIGLGALDAVETGCFISIRSSLLLPTVT
jgi:hypothetical protein